MGETTPIDQIKRYPWWLWPNLLGLDAPLIAVVWQRFFGIVFSVRIEPFISGLLFGIVWGIYLLDRWFDSLDHRSLEAGDRHHYAQAHRSFFCWMSVIVLGTSSLSGIFLLSFDYLLLGGLIGILSLSYLMLVHLVGHRFLSRGEKELLVGLLFAVGVGLPLFVKTWDSVPNWGFCLLGFGGLCWLNCQLIDRWESIISHKVHSFHPLAIGTISICCSVTGPISFSLSIMTAVVFLIALDLLRDRFSIRARRVFADLVLLTPVMFGWVP